MSTQYYVMHQFIDLDAAGAAWLWRRHLAPPDTVYTPRFLAFNDPALSAVCRDAAAVFDIGGVHDPLHDRFDHHGQSRERTAIDLVAAKIQAIRSKRIDHLAPLIQLIGDGDKGKLGDWPHFFQLGPHAIFNGQRRLLIERWTHFLSAQRRPSDLQYDEEFALKRLDESHLLFAFQLLDSIAAHLVRQHTVIKNLASYIVYRSHDGWVVGLKDAPYGAVGEAFKRGAELVVSTNVSMLPSTIQLELWKKRESPLLTTQNIDIAHLVRRLTTDAEARCDWGVRDECQAMYCESGFAVRGSHKAPDPRPLRCDFQLFCNHVDRLWVR